ncbi:ATPase [Blastococcus sp. CT_GayMR19]|uniref:AAA family ATPase n=1 Tax=Blastococcus sp. CT_GayMR19 TaxID=2559608 RepID=UPI0010734BB1|nr:AAA family ATPase [Blastococcus sp. CT_GayMR19]TFV76637.1 ATPase [Blastococcus sp. CT_GayMR19]
MPVRQPPFLLRVAAKNFRSLKDVDLRLSALNVLVGPNGAGKSNLLDIFAFLGDAVREDLAPAIVARGGFDQIRFRGNRKSTGSKVVLQVEAAVTKNSNERATDNYSLEFDVGTLSQRSGSRGAQVLRRSESFLFKRTTGPGRRITVSGRRISFYKGDEPKRAAQERTTSVRPDSLGLATLPRLGPEEGGEQVEALGSLFASFRVFDVDVEGVRRPSQDIRSEVLADDGTNLAPFLRFLSEKHPSAFASLEKDAQAFIPGLIELVFEDIGGSRAATVLRLREQGLDGLTDLADASYGSVRSLALLALLYDPNPPKLTCIEEIDHGLHPHVLDRLVELLREASRRTQLVVATHSPPLVNRLSAHELVVCERDTDGSSRIPAIDPALVREMEAAMEGELGLGELWFTGALGGVPES